jgi:hypothetical protein
VPTYVKYVIFQFTNLYESTLVWTSILYTIIVFLKYWIAYAKTKLGI